MRKLFLSILAAIVLLTPTVVTAQVFSQNQLLPTWAISGGIVVSTSTAPGAKLGTATTTTVTCSGALTCTPFTVIGSSPISLVGSGSGSPGGASSTIQYNANGAFNGNTGLVYTGTNVGIGSTSPISQLSIQSGSNVGLAIYNGSYTANGASTIRAGTTGNLILDASSGSGGAVFLNNDVVGNSILSPIGGNVGIGTSSPWGLLSVNPTSALGTAPAFAIGSSTGTNFIVNNAGLVGIGTTNPLTKFQVNGVAYANNIAGVELALNNAGTNFAEFYDPNLSGANGGIALGGNPVVGATPTSPTMFWNVNSGNVGVNTVTPNYNFLVLNKYASPTSVPFAVGSSTAADGSTKNIVFQVTNGTTQALSTMQIGGADNRGILTVQKAFSTPVYAFNSDPGDAGRTFVMENTATDNIANEFAGITLQINPTGGLTTGRTLDDIRAVRLYPNLTDSAIVTSAYVNGSYLDYSSIASSTSWFLGKNFGIASTSPTQGLSVQGNQYLSGNLFVGGAIIATSTLTLSALGTPAGAFLAVSPTGQIIATTTPSGGSGVTSVTGSYPVISSGGLTPALSLAFGTSTSNLWGGVQTFTNTPILSTLTGLVGSNNGGLYQIATSTSFATSVSNADGSLTIGPTTGAVVASLNTAHANSYSALQSFVNASSTVSSVTKTESLGATATTTINADGNGSIVVPSAGSITVTGLGTPAGTFLAAGPTGLIIATTSPSGGITAASNIQVFTATTSTWTMPAGTKTVQVFAIGCGGGGGSGSIASGGTGDGGGGGGNGAIVQGVFRASDITSPVTVTTCATGSGNGGAGVSGTNVNGNAGTAGSAVTFGTYLTAAGGTAGIAGNQSGAVPGANSVIPASMGYSLGSGGGGKNNGSGGVGGGSPFGFAGGSDGNPGQAGASCTVGIWCEGGNGGGGDGVSGSGKAGGAGGLYGGGGGGGASGTTGTTGNGGQGGLGIAVVVAYF